MTLPKLRDDVDWMRSLILQRSADITALHAGALGWDILRERGRQKISSRAGKIYLGRRGSRLSLVGSKTPCFFAEATVAADSSRQRNNKLCTSGKT